MIILCRKQDIDVGLIYNIIDITTHQPIYVGQTIKPLQQRWKEHKNCANRNEGFLVHHVMHKHGIENYICEPLEENLPNDKLNEREQYWIAKLQTLASDRKGGCNLTQGGDCRPDYITTTVHKYSLEGDYLETFSSLSEAGRSIGSCHQGILKVVQGKLNTAGGFRWSLERVDKLPVLNNNYTGTKKPVYQYSLDGELIQQYESTKAAARALNRSQGNISSAANGKRKTAYGFLWSFSLL